MDLEREVGALRCSKLNCYSEFNKMVQALSRCKHLSMYTMPGAKEMRGTSSEYNFYTTLGTMLQQVVSNNSVKSQKLELQRVYEWFKLNKPLLKPKTRPSTHKPKLAYASRNKAAIEPFHLERPQTAPASLYQTRKKRPSYSATLTGNGNRPRTTFTSAYVSRSLGHNLDFIGQTFDQLELPKTAESQSTSDGAMTTPPASGGARAKTPVQVSVQAHPLPNFLPGYVPPGFCGVQPHMADSVSFGEVFYFAPSVAAQMTLEKVIPREDGEMKFLRRRLVRGQATELSRRLPFNPTNTPATQSAVITATPPPTTPTDRELHTDNKVKDLSSSENVVRDDVSNPVPPRVAISTSSGCGESSQTAEQLPMRTLSSPHLLETIAEAECEIASSCGTGRTADTKTPTRNTPRGQTEYELPTEAEDDSESLESSPVYTHQPTVLISSTTHPLIETAPPPHRHPAVVSITFPADQNVLPSDSRESVRRPKKTPSVVAGFRKKRYQRPQTVPAIKIQSIAL